jgi:hypothetical protein
MVKLVREGVGAEEELLNEGGAGERGKRVGGGWVSGDRGLDPCHCIFLHSIQLLQNSLSHQSGGRRNLGLLQCHRGYTPEVTSGFFGLMGRQRRHFFGTSQKDPGWALLPSRIS